jgi:rhodanese-related sulfurtransferase
MQLVLPPPPPLEVDRTTVLDGIAGDEDAKKGWADSYSVDDQCFCESTFDHNIGSVMVSVPLFPNEQISIFDVCTLIGPGPGNYEIEPRPVYNDIQCGNGPPNDAGDEERCPGRVEFGAEGCSSIGPTWNWKKAFPYDVVELNNSQELKDLLDYKYFLNGGLASADAFIDVRSADEYNSGHIENSTLMENLNEFIFGMEMTSSSNAKPADIIGCQFCTIVVVCRSGSRARSAIDILRRSGFKGQLINGLGVSQWTEAGYPLVTTPSPELPSCAPEGSRDGEVCQERWVSYQQQLTTRPTRLLQNEPPSHSPSSFPSDSPSSLTSDSPSIIPSDSPSSLTSDGPSSLTSDVPSYGVASVPPSDTRSSFKALSGLLSDIPSGQSSKTPSGQTVNFSSGQPSDAPTGLTSDVPSNLISIVPSTITSDVPSTSQPLSTVPSLLPTDEEVTPDLGIPDIESRCIPLGGLCISNVVCCGDTVCNAGGCEEPQTGDI